MGNPFEQAPTRPFGIQSISAGSRRVVPIPVPPNIPDLMHWFDFTDPEQLFQDTGSTIPVEDNDDSILSILNKGFDGTKLTEDGIASAPVLYKTDRFNGLSTGFFNGVMLLSAVIAAGGIDQQVTIASTQLVGAQGPFDAFYYGWQTNRAGLRDNIGGGRNWEGQLAGATVVPNAGGGYGSSELHWFYGAMNIPPNVDNAKSRDDESGPETSQSLATFNPFVNPGQVFAIGDTSNSGLDSQTLHGEIGEVLVWNTFLDQANRNLIPDYFEAKYGGVFPIL